MADLSFQEVLIVGGVATVGFTLLSYWFSGVMARRNWSWQVKAKPKLGGNMGGAGANGTTTTAGPAGKPAPETKKA